MNLKVQQLMDATLVMANIIRENRKLPTKGKYLLGRMHAKLQAEFIRLDTERNDLIKSYGYKADVPNPAYKPADKVARDRLVSEGRLQESLKIKVEPETIEVDSVPEDMFKDFEGKWLPVTKTEIEVDVAPIHIDSLCFPGDLEDGEITGHEFIVLGDLITE
jgi:hypothetical protein